MFIHSAIFLYHEWREKRLCVWIVQVTKIQKTHILFTNKKRKSCTLLIRGLILHNLICISDLMFKSLNTDALKFRTFYFILVQIKVACCTRAEKNSAKSAVLKVALFCPAADVLKFKSGKDWWLIIHSGTSHLSLRVLFYS